MKHKISLGLALAVGVAMPVLAEWTFVASPTANAFIQSNNSSLELQCDRIRFAPAGYEDSKDIVANQGLSIRFMKDGTTEVGAFHVGQDNGKVRIVDNFPVEISFNDTQDYGFVLDQLAANASVNLSMIDQDVTYGIFDLTGSSAVIKSLRSACGGAAQETASTEAPEGVVYCGGGAVQRQIEYVILDTPDDEWDALLTVNGEVTRAMTAYSFFGNAEAPKGFVVALLGEDRSETLVFRDGGKDWLEYGDYQYDKCN
ncbi:hypothetical protein [Pseudoruegeria sp. SHC-113]|uniref:hypothetical protein n=1 Tax=Pseudoruegeria sp. SHC-113 TaxID=2855439 RepID=UPI0021BB9E67|nr:hypothetical protein [Pseudoruegeria sp. SHC-113]MCT8160026.1 hypothetical protein [Pseudoruegeria sp. SHC-113]